MQHTKVCFENLATDINEILVALLAEAGFEGFEEGESSMYAYINADDFNFTVFEDIVKTYAVRYTIETVDAQNWNATWESNFEPVIVSDFCTVRADFHIIDTRTEHEIIITPKMSFGTGHHATTRLMMEQMRSISFKGLSVLDFGTGTGILAILAEKLGAGNILAIDNDEWSYENSSENIERNNSVNIVIKLGSLDTALGPYQIILANINRHILLQYMNGMFAKLSKNGVLVLSGILAEEIVKKSALDAGFSFQHKNELNNWLAMKFIKSPDIDI